MESTTPRRGRDAKKPAARASSSARKPRDKVTKPAETAKTAVSPPKPGGMSFDAQVSAVSMHLGLEDLVSGGNRAAVSGSLLEARPGLDSQPLALEEVSQLLQQREVRGWHAGHGVGYSECAESWQQRLPYVRRAAVAGTLAMVTRQLHEVLHGLGAKDDAAKQAGVDQLVVLVGELEAARDRFHCADEAGVSVGSLRP